MAAPRPMTVDDYFETPETLTPMELIYGALRVADAPTPRHQSVVGSLFLTLDAHVRRQQLGRIWLAPVDVVLDERKALIIQPDLIFVSNARRGIVLDRIRGAPDLVVEVLSPRPRIGDTKERVGWFREYGVRECWLVHQDRRDITVVDCSVDSRRIYTANASIQSRVLPGFSQTLEGILGTGD